MTESVQQAILDAASYLARNQAGAGTAPGGPRGSSTDVVDSALESLLGARPETPAAFQTLLRQAFTTVEVDGRTETRYRRPSTAGVMMLTGGGVLTGAQASIVSRANRVRDEIYDNLDPLKPLALVPDPDALRDIRSLIHTVVDSIVEELSRPGGPTIIRVDQLLVELAGPGAVADPPVINAENFGGLLARLADEFGMDRAEISSLDDERTFTSFVCIVGAVSSLCSSWATDKEFLDPLTGEPYLGTQLVQIERSLAVVGQAVEEARRALDRAEVEPNEREQPRQVTIAGGRVVTTSIGAVLAWAEAFSKRGQDRIRYGGQDGIESFVSEADELADLVDALGQPPSIPPQDGLSGVGSRPVLDAFDALHRTIEDTGELAVRLQRQDLALTDAEFFQTTGGSSVGSLLGLYGSGFREFTAVRLFTSAGTAIAVDRLRVVSESRMDVFPASTASIARVEAQNGNGPIAVLELGPDFRKPGASGAARTTAATAGAGSPRPPLTLTDAALDRSEFAAARRGTRADPRARLTLRGSGFGRDSHVEVTTADGTRHVPTETRFISDARLEVAIGSEDEVVGVRVTNADGSRAELSNGSTTYHAGGAHLALNRVLPVRLELATRDPKGNTNRAILRPCLVLILFGSGFDDKTEVRLWSGGQELGPDESVLVSDSVLQVVVVDQTEDVDRIAVVQPAGRYDELLLGDPPEPTDTASPPPPPPPEPAVSESAPAVAEEKKPPPPRQPRAGRRPRQQKEGE